MTCIVGLETEQGVIIGADSAASAGWDGWVTRLKKVFRRGDFLIGYTSSFRMGQLLQYKLDVSVQKEGQEDLEFLTTTFIDAVRTCLKDGGFAKVENLVEQGGRFLVGYRGKLYVVSSDFQVNMSRDGYQAVGCGASYALGNLLNSGDLLPKVRVRQALKAAAHFSNGVCGPFNILQLGELARKNSR